MKVPEAAYGAAVGRKHDGRGDHWSCQWAAARFIDAHEERLLGPGRPFPVERGAEGHRSQPSRFSLMRAALPLSARR